VTPEEIRNFRDQLPDDAPQRNVLDGHLAQLDGRFDDAIASTERMIEISRQLGLEAMMLPPLTMRAELLCEQSRFAESIEAWTEVNEVMRSLGHVSLLSTTLVNTAIAHYRAGNVDEAERLAHEGEQLGAAEDIVNFAWGRGLRAMVAADRGEHETADELSLSALEYAYRTDFPRVRAEAHEARAHVLRAAVRIDEARSEYERALEIWERYGWVYKAERVRELLVEL
jgi:tetratricopeptide (TPR) repeat protein